MIMFSYRRARICVWILDDDIFLMSRRSVEPSFLVLVEAGRSGKMMERPKAGGERPTETSRRRFPAYFCADHPKRVRNGRVFRRKLLHGSAATARNGAGKRVDRRGIKKAGRDFGGGAAGGGANAGERVVDSGTRDAQSGGCE